VAAIDFTRDGRLVSVGRDKTPKLWKADFSQERALAPGADVGLSVAACDETGRILVGDWTGELSAYAAADGGRVGMLDPNPAPLTDRVAAAEREFAARKTMLDAAVAALAAAPDAEKPQAESAVIDLKSQVAKAAAEQARWFGEVAFQAGYDRLAKTLADRQAAVAAAESEWGVVEAKRRTDDQSLQAAAAKRDGLQQQADALATAITQAEQQVKDLAAQLEKHKAEMAQVQSGLPGATTEAETAAAAVAEATKAADERKAAIAARQAEADALAKELDALQGVAP
jgi:chromosome segregation ATPase